MDNQELLDRAFRYPLFEALAHRRTRRVGLGYRIDDKTTPFQSTKQPVSLSEMETALLCWAADGVSGAVLGEQQMSSLVHSSWAGRTHPNPCNSQNTAFAFINDEGIFFYRPGAATKIVEIENQADRNKILSVFKQNTKRTDSGRPEFPKQAWLSSNLWGVNMPGSTFFLPVVDVTYEYINFCLFAFAREGYFIMDQANNKPAGVQKWIDKKRFDPGFSLPLLMFESFVYNVVIAAAHYKVQNLALASEAMGLGNWTYSGFTPIVVLGGTPLCKGLGAQFITGKDGMPNPVRIPGQIDAYCPPAYKNMDAAVDAVVASRWGDGGIFAEGNKQVTPFRQWQDIRKHIKPETEEVIQITKDFCNYVHDTYGRFPAYFDALQVPVGATVCHVDEEFYDKYYPSNVLTQEHRDHFKIWHS